MTFRLISFLNLGTVVVTARTMPPGGEYSPHRGKMGITPVASDVAFLGRPVHMLVVSKPCPGGPIVKLHLRYETLQAWTLVISKERGA
jgi:hypothetical protein